MEGNNVQVSTMFIRTSDFSRLQEISNISSTNCVPLELKKDHQLSNGHCHFENVAVRRAAEKRESPSPLSAYYRKNCTKRGKRAGQALKKTKQVKQIAMFLNSIVSTCPEENYATVCSKSMQKNQSLAKTGSFNGNQKQKVQPATSNNSYKTCRGKRGGQAVKKREQKQKVAMFLSSLIDNCPEDC